MNLKDLARLIRRDGDLCDPTLIAQVQGCQKCWPSTLPYLVSKGQCWLAVRCWSHTDTKFGACVLWPSADSAASTFVPGSQWSSVVLLVFPFSLSFSTSAPSKCFLVEQSVILFLTFPPWVVRFGFYGPTIKCGPRQVKPVRSVLSSAVTPVGRMSFLAALCAHQLIQSPGLCRWLAVHSTRWRFIFFGRLGGG